MFHWNAKTQRRVLTLFTFKIIFFSLHRHAKTRGIDMVLNTIKKILVMLQWHANTQAINVTLVMSKIIFVILRWHATTEGRDGTIVMFKIILAILQWDAKTKEGDGILVNVNSYFETGLKLLILNWHANTQRMERISLMFRIIVVILHWHTKIHEEKNGVGGVVLVVMTYGGPLNHTVLRVLLILQLNIIDYFVDTRAYHHLGLFYLYILLIVV